MKSKAVAWQQDGRVGDRLARLRERDELAGTRR